MGRLERIGESRAETVERDLTDLGSSLDLQRRKLNHQAQAMELMASTLTDYAAKHQRLTERVEELEAELRYRLLPCYQRWQIHGLALLARLRERFV